MSITSPHFKNSKPSATNQKSTALPTDRRCFACDGSTCVMIFNCKRFRIMSLKDRVRLARDKGYFLIYLGWGHLVESYKATRSCMVAGCVGEPKHHTLPRDVALNENLIAIASLFLKMSVELHRLRVRPAHRNLTNNWPYLSCARLIDWRSSG